MLSGRYPSDEFAELRPRVVWDRASDEVTSRNDARVLAITSGGTIPDRGLYGVFLPDDGSGRGGRRVGELDEEMVYESRVGETFLLGASHLADRGDQAGPGHRHARSGRARQDAVLEGRRRGPARGAGAGDRRVPAGAGADAGRCGERRGCGATTRSTSSPPATWSPISPISGRRPASLPTDRTVVIERFRDELGDWRVCLLTPFGGRVHAPWAMAIEARLRERYTVDVQALWSDDGIVDPAPGGR